MDITPYLDSFPLPAKRGILSDVKNEINKGNDLRNQIDYVLIQKDQVF